MSAEIHSINNWQPAEVTIRASAAVAFHHEAIIAPLKAQIAALGVQRAELIAQIAGVRLDRDHWHDLCLRLLDIIEQGPEATVWAKARKALAK